MEPTDLKDKEKINKGITPSGSKYKYNKTWVGKFINIRLCRLDVLLKLFRV